MEHRAVRSPDRCPAHPGELLREVIPATGGSKSEIASPLGISRQHLYDRLGPKTRLISPARRPSGLIGWILVRCSGLVWSKLAGAP